jgi:type VI secretion system protein ImpC
MSDWTPDFGQLERQAPTWNPKRPVRIALLGDFSAGAARGRLDRGDDLAKRKPIAVEFDSLDDALARLDVQLTLPLGAKGAPVEMHFADLEAFHPDALYRDVELFSSLATLRQQLGNSATFAKAAAKVQGWAGGGKVRRASRVSRGSRSRGGALAADRKLDDFSRLVGRPATAVAAAPVDALLRDVMAPFVVAAQDPKKDALVASVDQALSDSMRALLHHAEFQNLESLWRGVDLLLRRLETGPSLQAFLIDMSAEELAADLSSAADLGDSALYKLLVDNPAKEKNGGFALICGLYRFEATPPHAELLGRMASIAGHADASFVTSLPADAFADAKRGVHPLVASAWAALRALPQAARLALVTPGFMLRHPYGKRSDPITAFAFEEFSNADGLRSLLYGHPALLVAALLGAPGGAKNPVVGELPFHYFIDGDGDQIALPCTERLLNVDAAAALARAGLVAVQGRKGQDDVRLAGLNAVNGSALTLPGQVAPAAVRGMMKTQVALESKLVGKPAPPPAADAESGDGDTDADSSSFDSDSSDDGAGSSDSSDLDALLSGMESSDAAPSEDASSDDAASDTSSEAEVDPELAALLKSLE